MRVTFAAFAILSAALGSLAAPSVHAGSEVTALANRADLGVTIWITSADDFCMIMPRYRQTIGDSEHPGGMRSYCVKPASTAQGHIVPGLWLTKHISTARGKSGGRQIQITGRINPSASSRLIPSDDGGQYDSNGGAGGRGNPEGSVCLGYSSYVELIEPSGGVACIRCCQNPSDCPLYLDTQGCRAVIPGDYS
ncbi:hypothetical protein OC846_002609 [Tilletia horrida]|uniref:Secreted protein n=1 Tax=Tilletia horrida TaxID=155126 RepID=A0AAN6GTD4_9BASI|nr:hypothetical protein OC845_002880 [Tilletia horrida]KAK0553237.1 hypothetical protein OC846_002609 [Tilletia horrida]KAK0565279.1 hypothetical protein OC861_003826 [Tilletia horrida]